MTILMDPTPFNPQSREAYINKWCEATYTSLFERLMHLCRAVPCDKYFVDKVTSMINTTSKKEINKKNSVGWTALMLACVVSKRWGVWLVELLLEREANPCVQSNKGMSVLMLACNTAPLACDYGVVVLLLKRGANPKAKINGRSALDIAAGKKDRVLMEILKEN